MGARYDNFGQAAEQQYQERIRRFDQDHVNQKLALQRYDQGRLRTQDLKNDAAEFALNEAKYPRYQPTASMGSTGVTRTRAPTAGSQIPTQQPSGYQYNIDYQAAQDAGNFLRALKGETGDATNRKTGAPDTTAALELLNKTPYSSINNATGISLDTDEQGNQMVSIMGPENTLLKQIPMATLEQQLSNLNNYANRERLQTTPAREAILGSKELAEGAAAARDAAANPSELGFTLKDGTWSKPYVNPKTGKAGIKTYNPEEEGNLAYSNFMQQYGPREATQQWRPDAGFANTQTDFGGYSLGFDVASRQPKKPTSGSTFDPLQLARQQAGVGGNNAGGNSELPPPDQANNPTGGGRYMPSPVQSSAAYRGQSSGYTDKRPTNTPPTAGYQSQTTPKDRGDILASAMQTKSQNGYNPYTGLNNQEVAVVEQMKRFQMTGQQVTNDTALRLMQQFGLPYSSLPKLLQYMQG